jgi:hypothetical protein
LEGKFMNHSRKLAALAAPLGITSQPCLGAVTQRDPGLAAVAQNAGTTTKVQFDLGSVKAPVLASASLSIAASQQTASEQVEVPKRKGVRTSTLLIVGWVLLAVVVLAAVASAMPTAGPREGAFD